MGSAAEHGAVPFPQPAGRCLGWQWLLAPEGRLFARQHHRTAHMGCSLQPGVNRTAATAIVPSLPLVISPLRRWGDHFQAHGAIPGTVERRQILNDKLPPGAGQHSLPALHRYHTHCFARGVLAPAFPHVCSQQFPAVCLPSLLTAGKLGSALCHLALVPCGGRGSPSQPSTLPRVEESISPTTSSFCSTGLTPPNPMSGSHVKRRAHLFLLPSPPHMQPANSPSQEKKHFPSILPAPMDVISQLRADVHGQISAVVMRAPRRWFSMTLCAVRPLPEKPVPTENNPLTSSQEVWAGTSCCLLCPLIS